MLKITFILLLVAFFSVSSVDSFQPLHRRFVAKNLHRCNALDSRARAKEEPFGDPAVLLVAVPPLVKDNLAIACNKILGRIPSSESFVYSISMLLFYL